MAFRFSDSTAVAAGTFNVHVIHPKWLAEVGLLPDGTKVRMSSDFRRPGFELSPEGMNVKWDIKPDRLIIVSKSRQEDCGGILASVLEALPWTPLLGVGVNVEFTGLPEDIDGLPESCSLPSCQDVEGYGLRQRTMHIGLTRGPHIFNMQVSSHEKVELSINVHTELGKKPSQREACELAIETCRNFFALREEATDLAKKILGVELSYEQNSD